MITGITHRAAIDPRLKRREQLESTLPYFTGSAEWYQHELGLRYTEGIKFVAQTAEAYWLLDLIDSYQPELKRRISAFTGEPGIPFQIWRLVVDLDAKSGVVTCHEDWDEDEPERHAAIVRQQIPYTDFPLPKFHCYFCDNTLLLPSEN